MTHCWRIRHRRRAVAQGHFRQASSISKLPCHWKLQPKRSIAKRLTFGCRRYLRLVITTGAESLAVSCLWPSTLPSSAFDRVGDTNEICGARPLELAIRLWSFCILHPSVPYPLATQHKCLLTLRWPSLTPSTSLAHGVLADPLYRLFPMH